MDLNLDEPTFSDARDVCACGHIESQRPISLRDAHDTTQGTRLIPPAFLPAEGSGVADAQVRTHRGRGGDPCALGGGAWGPDMRVETMVSGSLAGSS